MKNRMFQGAYGIIPTPFREDGKVDYNQVERMADRLCGTELAGIVVCGSTSEFVMLSVEENQEVMRAAANAIQGRKALVCGATGPDSRTCASYLLHMAKLGAQGALTAPPYYFRYSGDEVVEFYRALGRADCGVAVVAYQIPDFSSPIPLNKMQELMSFPWVAALKNSSANIKQIMHQIDLRNGVREDFSILTGTDDALAACLFGGCDGSFTALAALFPQTIVQIYRAVQAGDQEEAGRLQASLLPLTRLADRLPFPAGYKLLAEAALGMETSYRQPFGERAQGEMREIQREMRALLQKSRVR